jgi:hypothetical protein
LKLQLSSHPFYLFKQLLTYEVAWERIRILTVSEAYTSQKCHRRGNDGLTLMTLNDFKVQLAQYTISSQKLILISTRLVVLGG